jgi:tripartite-type tricarboxylate transporter receptor subunit TctC
VPTIAEQGISGFSMTLWFGMWVPAGTPPQVVLKLNGEVNRVLQMPELREQYATLGIDPVSMQPGEFAKFVREEIATNQRIVKQANIQQQ